MLELGRDISHPQRFALSRIVRRSAPLSSGLSQPADVLRVIRHVEKCQKRKWADLYSITSSARASSVGGTVRPRSLGSPQINDELIFGRILHRQVSGLFAFENAIDVGGGAPKNVDRIRSI